MPELTSVAELIMGQSPPSKTYNGAGEGLPFFQGKTDFGFRHPTPRLFCNAPVKIAKANDILLSVRAPVGPTNVADRECCIGRGLAAIRPRRIDGGFLLFNLRYLEKFIASLGGGSTFHQINKTQLGLVEVNRHNFEIPEQRKIAGVLELVQRAMEQQERLLALTAELKKALLHQLFTHGIRDEPQKQTEIGLIPESWEVVPLGKVMAEDAKNGLYKHSSHYGSGTLILRIDDFSNDGDIVHTATKRARLDPNEERTYRLHKDDIVVNRVNSLSHLGKTAVVGQLGETMVFESNMMRFRADPSKALPHYVFRWMNSPVCKTQVISSAKRAVAQSSINQGNLRAITMPLPPLAEQAEIVRYFEHVEAKVSLHRRKQAALSALFRTLLHELMTARVRVHDLDLSNLEVTAATSQ